MLTAGDCIDMQKSNIFNSKSTLIFSRKNEKFVKTKSEKINFISTTPSQIISVGTGLIPFLEHNDANRALMGSNMQRQAVPLIKLEKPIVQTGLEKLVAKESQGNILAKKSGIIKYISSSKIIIYEENKIKFKRKINPTILSKTKKTLKLKKEINKIAKIKTHFLEEIKKSNQNTVLKNIPIVTKNQWVKKGETLAESTGTHRGKLSLGKNLLIGYMGWEGYNFEDAVVINERIIEQDILSSIHIKRYKTFLISNDMEEVRT